MTFSTIKKQKKAQKCHNCNLFFRAAFVNARDRSIFAPQVINLKLSNMNKGELISNVADKAGLTKAQAGDALNAVLDNISGALSDGDKVTLIGFGTFSINRRNARKGRNPRTNEVIDIPAKNIVKFKAGKEFTENVQ